MTARGYPAPGLARAGHAVRVKPKATYPGGQAGMPILLFWASPSIARAVRPLRLAAKGLSEVPLEPHRNFLQRRGIAQEHGQ